MKLRVQCLGNMRLRHPADWQAELIPDMNGMLVMDPAIENEWQANLFFEHGHDPEGRDMEVTSAEMGLGLREAKMGFQLVEIDWRPHATGREMAVIEYQSMQDGVELHQWDIVIALDANDRLYVTAASERNLWGKYQPIFDAMVQSIRFD